MSQAKLSAFGFKRTGTPQNEPVDNNEKQHSSTVSSTQSDPLSPSLKPKRAKRFQNSWLTEFGWLRIDTETGKMFCMNCEQRKGSKINPMTSFTSGCFNYQRSALVRHQSSDEHRLSSLEHKQQRFMTAAVENVKKKHGPLLEAQLRTALYLARENISNTKFLSMIDLQISNVHLFATSEDHVKTRPPGIYTNNEAASNFQGYLARVIQDMAIYRIQSSPYIGIMVDESLDIATTKKLVLFCRIMHNGQMRVEFGANIEILDGKADTVYKAIIDWLQSVGVNIAKVSGFGSDGASVLTGRHSGVGIRLRRDNPRIVHVWCAAHRVALVSYWAAKKIPYLQELQRTLVNIYIFYEFSAPRYNKVRELQRVMGAKVKRFKKPTQVRWLSLQDAIEAVFESWGVLVLGLEHEVAHLPNSEGGNKAKGILKMIKTFKFVSAICLLRDILDCLCKLSKFLQKDILDIEQVDNMITVTKETISLMEEADYEPETVQQLISDIDESDQYKGIQLGCSLRDRMILMNMRRMFVRNILAEFEQRFPPEDMKILKDMNNILNPKKLPEGRQDIVSHGTESLESISHFYGDLIDSNRANRSFLPFKFLLNVNRHKSLSEMCFLILSDYTEEFADFCTMAKLLLTVPLTSVPCERGFSLQNRHVSTFTNRRNVKNAENRMIIAYAAKRADFNEHEVITKACQLAMR